MTKAGSAGLPFFHTDVRIADSAGEAVAANEAGGDSGSGPTHWRLLARPICNAGGVC